jgi:hypothetical protein
MSGVERKVPLPDLGIEAAYGTAPLIGLQNFFPESRVALGFGGARVSPISFKISSARKRCHE